MYSSKVTGKEHYMERHTDRQTYRQTERQTVTETFNNMCHNHLNLEVGALHMIKPQSSLSFEF